jgi:hypothetical protein
MTGGVGDYFVDMGEEEQPAGVRAIRGFASAAAAKWAATENKAEVLG